MIGMNLIHNSVVELKQKPTKINEKYLHLLAHSIFKELMAEGGRHRDVLTLSAQLIGMVTSELQQTSSKSKPPL